MYLTKQAKKEMATRIVWYLENYENDKERYQRLIDNIRFLEKTLDSVTLCDDYQKLDKEIRSIFAIAQDIYNERKTA